MDEFPQVGIRAFHLRGFVDQKLEEQTEFVRWWKETVGVRHGDNRYSIDNADPRSLPKSDAESLTGITQQQVSKWAKKLQKPEQYRAQLFGAAYILSANVHRRHPTTTWTTYFEYFEYFE